MESQDQAGSLPFLRVLLGVGFVLIIAAVAIGAAMKGQSAIPKYVALMGALCAAVGGIGSAVMDKRRQKA